jgi:hypothetical protein
MRDSNHPSREDRYEKNNAEIQLLKRPGPVRHDSASFQRARKFLPAMAPALSMHQAIRSGS